MLYANDSSQNVVYLNVKVKPSSKDQKFLFGDNQLIVHLKSSPTKGKANKELISFISKLLKIKKTDLEVFKGHKNRDKIIAVYNHPIELLHDMIKELS